MSQLSLFDSKPIDVGPWNAARRLVREREQWCRNCKRKLNFASDIVRDVVQMRHEKVVISEMYGYCDNGCRDAADSPHTVRSIPIWDPKAG